MTGPAGAVLLLLKRFSLLGPPHASVLLPLQAILQSVVATDPDPVARALSQSGEQATGVSKLGPQCDRFGDPRLRWLTAF